MAGGGNKKGIQGVRALDTLLPMKEVNAEKNQPTR